MKRYVISEAQLRHFIEESLLLECLMEEDPPLDAIKAQACEWEDNKSWDDIVDDILQKEIAKLEVV